MFVCTALIQFYLEMKTSLSVWNIRWKAFENKKSLKQHHDTKYPEARFDSGIPLSRHSCTLGFSLIYIPPARLLFRTCNVSAICEKQRYQYTLHLCVLGGERVQIRVRGAVSAVQTVCQGPPRPDKELQRAGDDPQLQRWHQLIGGRGQQWPGKTQTSYQVPPKRGKHVNIDHS